jgi:hypothetical protein
MLMLIVIFILDFLRMRIRVSMIPGNKKPRSRAALVAQVKITLRPSDATR